MRHWLLLGCVAGDALVMWTNPVRASLRDGARALKRYPALWLILGCCGFGYALFHLAAQVYLAMRMPEDSPGRFIFFRQPFRWEAAWWYGSEKSFWYLPPGSVSDAGYDAIALAVESTAGIFNNLVSTFPLASLASLLLWIN